MLCLLLSIHGIPDLPVHISAGRLKDRIEQEFEEGVIDVERTGHCARYEWKFTWKTHGGNHPEMKVNGSGLRGVEVLTEVKTIDDGGLFLDPIPGEFLRMPATQPEVSGLHAPGGYCPKILVGVYSTLLKTFTLF